MKIDVDVIRQNTGTVTPVHRVSLALGRIINGADGDSAYQAAVKNGFKGTEGEYVSAPLLAANMVVAHNSSPTSHTDIRTRLNKCVKLPEYDSTNYQLTFTEESGAKLVVDLPLEIMGFDYDEQTKEILFSNADSIQRRVSLVDFVDIYTGSIGEQIQVSVESGNVIHATLLNDSVSWKSLDVTLRDLLNSMAGTAVATTSANGLMSASDKTKLEQSVNFRSNQNLDYPAMDTACSNIGAMQMLRRATVTTPLTISGGFVYNFSGASLSVPGVVGFKDTQDSAMIIVAANIAVSFSPTFKLISGISNIAGTSSQYKIYIIQRVPVSSTDYIYAVTCSLFG